MAGTAKWGDAKNIVETVYGGALLRGTYHRYDLEDVNTYEDYSIPRWPLVQLKNNFTPIMRGPMMPVKAEEFEFHSKEHFETFEKSMERSEIYLGGNLKIFGSFATSIKGGRLKEDEMFKRKVSEKMFYCRVRNEFVPIASVQLNSDDIILTDKAYKALIEFCDQHVVKNTGTNEDMYEKCEYFFENFGTHVNVGLVHLGGILTWKSEFFAETNASETEIQSLVKSSLAANANAGFATSEAGASAEFSATRLKHVGKFSQKDLASTFVSRRIYGGSAAAKSAYDWYQSLRDDSLTWVIVDRGDRKTNDQIGVWDIIRQSKQPIKIYHKDNNMVEVDKDKLKEKLFAIFNQWLYRRKIKVIINGLEKEPNASDYLKTLEKIETENKTRKDRFGAFDNNNSWYFLLKEEKEISDFLLKPLNLEQTQTAFLIKINTQITESLLDEKSIGGNGRSDEKFVVDLRKKVERKLASDEIRVEMNNGMKITDGTKYLHSLKRISKKLSKIEAVDWIQILNEDTPANEKRSASNQILNEDTPANEKRSAYLLKPVNNRFWCSAKEEIYGEIKILAAYTGQQDFQNEIQDMLNKAQESSFCHIL